MTRLSPMRYLLLCLTLLVAACSTTTQHAAPAEPDKKNLVFVLQASQAEFSSMGPGRAQLALSQYDADTIFFVAKNSFGKHASGLLSTANFVQAWQKKHEAQEMVVLYDKKANAVQPYFWHNAEITDMELRGNQLILKLRSKINNDLKENVKLSQVKIFLD